MVFTVSGNRRGPGRQGPVKVRGGSCEKKKEKLSRRYKRCNNLGYKGTLGCPYAVNRQPPMRNFLERTCDKLDVWMGGCGFSCVVNGNWGEFSAWSECSQSCGGGIMTRTRKCDDPEPGEGGADCEGESEETDSCNEDPCPVDGMWSEWEDGECSATCGGGTMIRTRSCDNPAPENGGADCEGNDEETAVCNEEPCPEIVVEPTEEPASEGWSRWRLYENSYCYLDDNDICKVDKYRECPEGNVCEGDEFEKVFNCPKANKVPECQIPTGPVDGGYSDWRTAAKKCHWDENNDCKMKYKRKCNRPKQRNGGKSCEEIGEPTKEDDCPEGKQCKSAKVKEYGDWAGYKKQSTSCDDVEDLQKCLVIFECDNSIKCNLGSYKYKKCKIGNEKKREKKCPKYFKNYTLE